MVLKEAQNMKDQFGYEVLEFEESPSGMFLSPGGGRTPIQAESERFVNDIINNGGQSMYGQSTRSGAFTPGYDLGFSPGHMLSPNYYASPTHIQASPGYGSPLNPG